MICGASRLAQPEVSGRVITVMEQFAEIIAEHVSRERAAATERRAEAAEAALNSRGRFLAQADHQLKTPLTVLRGALEVLQQRWEVLGDAEREQWFGAMKRSADTLGADIDALLAEAPTDLQSRELVAADVDVVAVAATMTQAFDALADRDVVRSEVEGGLRAWVDPTALAQVLGHLLERGQVLAGGRARPGDGPHHTRLDRGVGRRPGARPAPGDRHLRGFPAGQGGPDGRSRRRAWPAHRPRPRRRLGRIGHRALQRRRRQHLHGEAPVREGQFRLRGTGPHAALCQVFVPGLRRRAGCLTAAQRPGGERVYPGSAPGETQRLGREGTARASSVPTRAERGSLRPLRRTRPDSIDEHLHEVPLQESAPIPITGRGHRFC